MEASEALQFFNSLIPFWIIVFVITLGIILLVFQFQKSLFRQRLEKESLKNQHQQDLLRTAITVQENERQRIARDLHDELGTQLSVALMQLKQVNGSETAAPDAVAASLPKLEAHLDAALRSTKRISYELMPPQLMNLGLYQALRVLVEEMREAGRLTINLSKTGAMERLSWPMQLGLYRMVSELLHNTLKHAGASAVTIALNVRETDVQCVYRDNGQGLPNALQSSGLGFRNLEARAGALHGSLEWGNAAEGGFHAKLVLPLEADDAEVVT